MIVVDTNVLAYLLIEGDHTSDAQALFAHDPEWKSEAFLLVEFSNILVTYLRTGQLSRAHAHALLSEAEKNLSGVINLPHIRALRVAEEFSVSAYDARFLGTAYALDAKLVTEDSRLRAAAPALTMSIAEALQSRRR
jgi:predicted nucleic acid-binding protein